MYKHAGSRKYTSTHICQARDRVIYVRLKYNLLASPHETDRFFNSLIACRVLQFSVKLFNNNNRIKIIYNDI